MDDGAEVRGCRGVDGSLDAEAAVSGRLSRAVSVGGGTRGGRAIVGSRIGLFRHAGRLLALGTEGVEAREHGFCH